MLQTCKLKNVIIKNKYCLKTCLKINKLVYSYLFINSSGSYLFQTDFLLELEQACYGIPICEATPPLAMSKRLAHLELSLKKEYMQNEVCRRVSLTVVRIAKNCFERKTGRKVNDMLSS